MDSRTMERSELEAKVLPELQKIAEGLGVTHQRMRKSDLIDAIVAKANGGGARSGPKEAPAAEAGAPVTTQTQQATGADGQEARLASSSSAPAQARAETQPCCPRDAAHTDSQQTMRLSDSSARGLSLRASAAAC